MQNKNPTKEVRLILDIVKKRIGDKRITYHGDDLNRINWDLLREMIVYHELAPFAYSYFESYPFTLPKEIMEFFKKEYYFTLFRNLYFEQEFLRLNHIFIEKDLIMVPIKGLALLEDIYKQYPFRPMEDMDVLVAEEDIEKAEAILIKSGYSKHIKKGNEVYWRTKNCNIPFIKKNGEKYHLLELHFALDLKRFNRNILPDLWKRLRLLDINKAQIKLLSPEDTLFSLALHQRRFGKRLCLKNTLDVTLLLNKYKNNFDWDYVLRQSRSDRICSTISFVLFQAKILLDITIPQSIWKSLKVSFWKKNLMYQLIKKNTFLIDSFDKAKYVYLKSHFLLYDNLWEPILRLLHITQEEFAKFYNLLLYAPHTKKLYKLRFFYMPYRLIKDSFRKLLKYAGPRPRHKFVCNFLF